MSQASKAFEVNRRERELWTKIFTTIMNLFPFPEEIPWKILLKWHCEPRFFGACEIFVIEGNESPRQVDTITYLGREDMTGEEFTLISDMEIDLRLLIATYGKLRLSHAPNDYGGTIFWNEKCLLEWRQRLHEQDKAATALQGGDDFDEPGGEDREEETDHVDPDTVLPHED